MKSKLLSTLFLLGFGSVLFAGVHGTHWGYTGHEDPNHWAELNPDFFMCRDGRNQSPINIDKKDIVATVGLEDLDINYKTGATEALNNGHTIKVSVAPGSFVKIDGIEFELKQFHFHSPSENQIDGKNFPLEAHFVHSSKKGELLVLAVMYKQGSENKVLKKVCSTIFSDIDKAHKCTLNAKDINNLLPKGKSYYRFDGSLTTPPCSEGVRWFVLQDYSSVGAAQIEKFVNVMMKGHNNRPTQPLNARKILK
jgi:carbonic anhydrase